MSTETLREAVERLANKWDARFGPFPNGFQYDLPIGEVTGALRALLAEHPATPAEEVAEVAVEEREPLLLGAARRMAETHPHRHIRIVSGSGTTVGRLVAELDEWVAALTAKAKAEAWDEGFDRGFYDPLAGHGAVGRDASESAAVNPYDREAT